MASCWCRCCWLSTCAAICARWQCRARSSHPRQLQSSWQACQHCSRWSSRCCLGTRGSQSLLQWRHQHRLRYQHRHQQHQHWQPQSQQLQHWQAQPLLLSCHHSRQHPRVQHSCLQRLQPPAAGCGRPGCPSPSCAWSSTLSCWPASLWMWQRWRAVRRCCASCTRGWTWSMLAP
jgi:hypothetical protein